MVEADVGASPLLFCQSRTCDPPITGLPLHRMSLGRSFLGDICVQLPCTEGSFHTFQVLYQLVYTPDVLLRS